VYVPVPPEGFAVNVAVWPLSIVGGVGVGAPATKVELVVTGAEACDVVVSGSDALSQTCSSNV
jgi:hypothetical protein